MALPTKFTITWRRRPGSPRTRSGTSGATRNNNSSCFWCARIAKAFMVSRSMESSEKSITSTPILPDSILEKSRISLMIFNSASADDLTRLMYSRCSALSSVSSAKVVMPMMPFIGVRISWLMLAKKSLLTCAARSAASLASRIASSDCLRSVMSENATTSDSNRPFASVLALDTNATGKTVPSLRTKT